LARVSDWSGNQISYEYDQLNRIITLLLPNGTRKKISYDDNNRVSSLRHEKSDQALLQTYGYTYNLAGQISSRTEETAGAVGTLQNRQSTYAYDPINRLLTATTGGTTTLYSFNPKGELISKTMNGTTTNYTYDPLGRLLSTTDGTNNLAYTYDAVDQRISKIYNGMEDRYLVDGGRSYCKLDNAGNVQNYYIYAGPLNYSLDAGGNLLVYHEDEKGSVVGITDVGQALVQSYAYAPYGKVIGSTGTISNEFRYIGTHGVMVDENGLYYMRARYYDPESKRFITEDPLRLSAGMNLYAYVGGDPVNLIDPSGLSEEKPYKVFFDYDELWDNLDDIEAKVMKDIGIGELSETAIKAKVREMVTKILPESAVKNRFKELRSLGEYILEKAKNDIIENAVQEIGKTSNIYDVSKKIGTKEMAEVVSKAPTVASNVLNEVEGNALKITLNQGSHMGPFKKIAKIAPGAIGVGFGLVALAMSNSDADASEIIIGMVSDVNPISSTFDIIYGTTREWLPFDGWIQNAMLPLLTMMATPENTVNLSKYYQQKYKHEYDISDRLDQKIDQWNQDMALFSILSLTSPY
jgi:RHS repeat-associated protein